jgi:hypothetical protein
MNLFYGNIDFPGNNIVFWRPNDDAKDCPLPKRWRFIVKDTDFGLGLYGRKSDYNTIDLLYNPSKHPNDNWAFTEPATLLFKNMMEDPDMLKMFIDKSCVFMGDFMNAEGTGATMDAILDEALEEFVAHRDKYNPGWGGWGNDNRQDILNKFEDAKKWLAGYEEAGWGGWWGGGQTTVYLPRTDYFLQFLSEQYKLGDAIPVTINKDLTGMSAKILVNDIPLSQGTFNGKLFVNRQVTLQGIGTNDQTVTGWDIEQTASDGTVTKTHIDGATYTFNMPTCKELAIDAVIGKQTGIANAEVKDWKWNVADNTLYVSGVQTGTLISLYDLQGMLLQQFKADGSAIQLPIQGGQVFILKVGTDTIKVK